VRLTRCLRGLVKRRLSDLSVAIGGRRPSRELLDKLLPLWCKVALSGNTGGRATGGTQSPEVEIAFAAGGHFSPHCACRVLIVPPGASASRELVRQADFIFADDAVGGSPAGQTYPLASLDAVLQRQLGFTQLAPAERIAAPLAA
jgi:hypothetical protein